MVDNLIFKSIRHAEQTYNAAVYVVLSNTQKRVQDLRMLLIDSDFISKVNSTLKEFVEPTEIQQELMKRNGVEIIMYDDSINDWQDYHSAIRSCALNYKIMKSVMFDGKYTLSQEVQLLLISDDFKTLLQHTLRISKCIVELEEKLRPEITTMADAVELMIEFCDNINWVDYKMKVDRMLEDTLHPILLSANFLHPSYKGRKFESYDVYSNKCDEFLLDLLSGAGLSDLYSYRNAEGMFEKLF